MSELIGEVVKNLSLALKRNDQLEASLGEALAKSSTLEKQVLDLQQRTELSANETAKWRKRSEDLTKQLQELHASASTFAEQVNEWKPIVDKVPELEKQLDTSNRELRKALQQIAEMETHPDVREAKIKQLREQAKLIGQEMKRIQN